MHTQACQWIGMSKRDNGQAASSLKIFRFISLVFFTFLNKLFFIPSYSYYIFILIDCPFYFYSVQYSSDL